MTEPHPDLDKVKGGGVLTKWCQNQWKKVQKVPAIPVLLGALVVTQLPGLFNSIASLGRPYIYETQALAKTACDVDHPLDGFRCRTPLGGDGEAYYMAYKKCVYQGRTSYCLANDRRYYYR